MIVICCVMCLEKPWGPSLSWLGQTQFYQLIGL